MKPKVLIVVAWLKLGGGAEKVAADTGNYLTDQGYETHLLTFYEAAEKYPYHGTYHTFGESLKNNWLRKLCKIPRRIIRLHRYARRHQFDVVCSCQELANIYCLLTRWFFFWRRPVIVSVHTNPYRLPFLAAIPCYLRRVAANVLRRLYRRANLVVAVSSGIEQILKNDWHLKNTTTIYNVIDPAMVTRQTSQPLPTEYAWLTKHRPLVLTIGRLVHVKGQWHLIRAFTKVRARHKDATLVILGEGEYREQLQKLIIDCGLTKHVYLAGNHKNIYPFLAAADVFVLSSLFEGLSNVLLEALAVGLPVIATDCAVGPREIMAPMVDIGETIVYPHKTPYGTLTQPPENLPPVWHTPNQTPLTPVEEQLATAIHDTLKKTNVGRDTTLGQKRIAETFSLSVVMRKWEGLITNTNTK